MSKYTTELRYICEYEAGKTESKGYDDVDEILTASAPKIFSFTFPIFDNNYKLPLINKSFSLNAPCGVSLNNLVLSVEDVSVTEVFPELVPLVDVLWLLCKSTSYNGLNSNNALSYN